MGAGAAEGNTMKTLTRVTSFSEMHAHPNEGVNVVLGLRLSSVLERSVPPAKALHRCSAP